MDLVSLNLVPTRCRYRSHEHVASPDDLILRGEDKDLAERALGKIELLGPQDWERETTARNLRLLAEKTEDSAWIPELAERLAP